MEVQKTKLKDVFLIKPEVQEDFRGTYVEIFHKGLYEEKFAEHGLKINFVCDDLSTSIKGVLRGLHADTTAYKLISCAYGRIYFVVLNCEESLGEYGKWESFVLSDANRHQVLVPPKFANGHLVLSETATFAYKQSEYYDPARQSSIRFDDPRFNIWWPIKTPLLSRRDEEGKYVN
jgi:dTDP-4-dehydrorhamnose 3,5-epimerase